MARIPFIGSLTGKNTASPQAGSAPTQPTEQILGHTEPQPDPGTIRPRAGAIPLGASGRANFYGLPQTDELNKQLTGPQGLRLLDEMYRTDAHVRRLVLAAWSPITAGTWTLEAYGGENATDADRQIAETIWWMLTEWMSPTFTEHLATAGPLLLRAGFCPFEALWGTVEYKGKTLLGPRKLDVRLPRSVWRWWQDDYGELTHIGQILPNKPQAVIPASELVYYRLGNEGDNWQGTSLLRHAYKHWMLKDKLERIDAIGQERKAVGVPIVYHSPDVHEATLAQIERTVANMHVSEVAYLMLPGRKMGTTGPQGMQAGNEFLIDVVQFDSSSGDSIKGSIEYHQQAISSSFLTDFLELGHHQVGARATAQVQEDPFLTAINGALLPPVLPPLNRLIDRIRKLNWGSSEGSPQLQLTLHDEASLSEIATYVQQLVAAEALQVDPELEDWLRDRGGLPPANPDVRAQRQQAQQAAMENAANAANGLDGNGEPAGSEPPNPDDTRPPGKPAAKQRQATPAPAKKEPAEPGKQLDAPSPPPNLRDSDSDESEQPEHECGTCRMFDQGKCWGYGNLPVNDEWVCDSWELSPNWQEQDEQADAAANPKKPAAAGKQLDATVEPTARWFDRLLSQHQLRQAFDGCREHIQAACLPATLTAARKLAGQAANGVEPANVQPPAELVDALTTHYTDLYQLGHQTVANELAKQRQALTKTLDDPADIIAGTVTGARLKRARRRGQHSAQNIVNSIAERLGRDQITGLKEPADLQVGAEQAAQGQLRMEALSNTAAMVNDGRYDGAMSAGDVIGGVYTATLDARSCDACIAADTGDVLPPDQAILAGPPNPDCEGGDYCRCTIVWVLSDDPAALGAVVGEGE